MTYFERIEDHTDRALEKRSSAYFVPDVADLLTPLTKQIQELEAVFWQIFDARFVGNATGEALRLLGLLVGAFVTDDGDEGLRLRIRLKVRALLSAGRRSEILRVLDLVVGIDWAITGGEGVVAISQLSGDVLATDLFRVLSFAVGDGILLQLDTKAENADAFDFGSFDGAIIGGEWDSEDGAITGDPWLTTRI